MATETATILLERERELAELDEALTDARAGAGGVVLLEAPAGLGKTSLLRAAARSASEGGFRCLRARAGELERDFAYGCVRQLLEPVVARAAGARRDRLLGGAAALSQPLFAPAEDCPRPAADGAFSVLHGLYWLLNNIADEGPVALFVDDLHWSDTESLRFLNYLAPRLDGLAVAVLATTRPGEGDTAAIARLAAAPETRAIGPRPLSGEATAALCERRLGSEVAPEFAAACREATGGNPFFLEALLREARERGFPTDAAGAQRVRGIGPAAVAQAVLLRLEGRPAAARSLVHAAAVLGDGASPGEAARLAEVQEPDATEAADLLAALAILKPADRLEFAHPIVREAVYAEIGPRERAQAHARAARILAAGGAADERIAAQLVEADPAGDPERVEL
ncbi:MAG TPA: AAA family ATPase, partial [Thermoleophilaceae bacterium]|nr:AAA family ATPase [Thermoleophilaceae bacterium]